MSRQRYKREMVTLTGTEGKVYFILTKHIVGFYEERKYNRSEGTIVLLDNGGYITVTETPGNICDLLKTEG